MILALVIASVVFAVWFAETGSQAGKILHLAILVGVGLGAYALAALALGVVSRAQLRTYLRRG